MNTAKTYHGKPCPHGHTLRYYSRKNGCVTCRLERKRKYRQANPHKQHKCSPPTRPKPELCERPGCDRPAKVLDHNHRTGQFRGWLCNGCNWTLGVMRGDSLETFDTTCQQLREYLLR